jgi:hypothetical protein
MSPDLTMFEFSKSSKLFNGVIYHTFDNEPKLNLEKIKYFIQDRKLLNEYFYTYVSKIDWNSNNADKTDQNNLEQIINNSPGMKAITIISKSIRHIRNVIYVAEKLDLQINGIVIEESDVEMTVELSDLICGRINTPILVFPKLSKYNSSFIFTDNLIPKFNGQYLDEFRIYIDNEVLRYYFHDITKEFHGYSISLTSESWIKMSKFLEIENLQPKFIRCYAISSIIKKTILNPFLIVYREGIINTTFRDLKNISN